MSENSDRLRDNLLEATEKAIEVEKVVQLYRIADKLAAIENSGIYTWPQDVEEETPINHVERRRP